MLSIPITVDQALQLCRDPDIEIELVAEAPGIALTLYVATRLQQPIGDRPEGTGPPPMLNPSGPADDDQAAGGNVCSHCGRTFASPNGLSVHIGRTHGKPKPAPTPKAVPYKAPDVEHVCEDCGISFATGSGLGGHRKKHRPANEPEAEEQPSAEVTSIERGRECTHVGCTTRLSAYNKKDKCGVHDTLLVPPKFATN